MNNYKALFIGLLFASQAAISAPNTVDRVAAVVNNGVILQSEVDELLSSIKKGGTESGQQLPNDKVLRAQVLDQLIMENIQVQLAEKMNIKITDEMLDAAIADIAIQNKMSINDLKSKVAATGLSYKAYRSQIRKQMMMSEARNNDVRPRVNVLPQEVENLTKELKSQKVENPEINLSQIMLPLSEEPTQQELREAEALATKIVAQVKKGGDFKKLAITYSTDQRALQGGDMGWSKLYELPTLFTNNLLNAKTGQIVGPIRSGVGFHILKVNDIRNAQASVTVEEIHARHILLSPSVLMSDEQAKNKLTQIQNEIKSGNTTFETAAKQFSQDPGSALQGGDLGWAAPNIYDPVFAKALVGLKNGAMSAPIRSSFGWHLIERLGSRKVDKTDSAHKEKAYGMIFNRKFAEETQLWLQEQRANAYIKIK